MKLILQIYLFYSAHTYIAFTRFWFKRFANVDPPNNLLREVQLAYPLYKKATRRLSHLPKVIQRIRRRTGSKSRQSGSRVHTFNLSVRSLLQLDCLKSKEVLLKGVGLDVQVYSVFTCLVSDAL